MSTFFFQSKSDTLLTCPFQRSPNATILLNPLLQVCWLVIKVSNVLVLGEDLPLLARFCGMFFPVHRRTDNDRQ